MYGYTLSKNSKNNSGDAPSPYLTPMFYRNVYIVFVPLSKIIPLDCTYILRIICIRSRGISNSSPITFHNLALFIESYALRKSMNASPNYFFALILCWMRVWRMRACSVVVCLARNPAYVGACSCLVLAMVVSRWFMVAMNILAKGGGMAMLL